MCNCTVDMVTWLAEIELDGEGTAAEKKDTRKAI